MIENQKYKINKNSLNKYKIQIIIYTSLHFRLYTWIFFFFNETFRVTNLQFFE